MSLIPAKDSTHTLGTVDIKRKPSSFCSVLPTPSLHHLNCPVIPWFNRLTYGRRWASRTYDGKQLNIKRHDDKHAWPRGSSRSRSTKVGSHRPRVDSGPVNGVIERSTRACRRPGQQRPREEAGRGRSKDWECTAWGRSGPPRIGGDRSAEIV